MSHDTAIYIILNEKLKELEDWRLPNVVTMLGLMIGTKVDPACIGPDITDGSEIVHAGIGNVVMPILSVKADEMADFYQACKEKEGESWITVFDFPLCGQNATEYSVYEEALKAKKLEEQTLLGLAIYGHKKPARSLCGSLPRWK